MKTSRLDVVASTTTTLTQGGSERRIRRVFSTSSKTLSYPARRGKDTCGITARTASRGDAVSLWITGRTTRKFLLRVDQMVKELQRRSDPLTPRTLTSCTSIFGLGPRSACDHWTYFLPWDVDIETIYHISMLIKTLRALPKFGNIPVLQRERYEMQLTFFEVHTTLCCIALEIDPHGSKPHKFQEYLL